MDVAALRTVPLFSSLDDNAARELCGIAQVRECESGLSLFHAGQEGDALYLVESGCVRITLTDADGKKITLAELGAGEFFGEMSVIDGRPRSADATVMKQSRLAVLGREDFIALCLRQPAIGLEMLTAIGERLRHADEMLRHRVSRNVNEAEAERLTLADRAADLIAEFGGSWKFIGACTVFLIAWVLLNTWLLFDKGFDPFPYVLLNLVLGMITGLQAPIIMMSQNRQSSKDRLRADLDYDVNLKNEMVLTEILRRLERLERRMTNSE
ncbi:MAG TPA: DUF1003 domain-containing protein [Chthoniobacterales bacterium]|nr:DUF1003 domain-containing protein [Chthoniobacterales bacterium]